jgi:hypothetical protein
VKRPCYEAGCGFRGRAARRPAPGRAEERRRTTHGSHGDLCPFVLIETRSAVPARRAVAHARCGGVPVRARGGVSPKVASRS